MQQVPYLCQQTEHEDSEETIVWSWFRALEKSRVMCGPLIIL